MGVYDVVITGFLPGSDPTEAKLRLTALFKATPGQIERMCASLPYTVKSAVDAGMAAKYRTALELAGVQSEVVDRNLSADLPPIAESAATENSAELEVNSPETERPRTKEWIYGIWSLIAIGVLAANGYKYISKRFSAPEAPSTSVSASNHPQASAHEQKLRKYAIQDLHQSKFSLAKREGLCDRITDEEFDFTFGSATINVDGSGKARTLPSAVVRHRFTCAMNALAQKNQEEQWNILALDEEFETLRCIRTGSAEIVASNYVNCAFQPSDGIAPKFPPPDQVDERFRAKYSELLGKIRGEGNTLSSSSPADVGGAEPASATVGGVLGSPSFALDEAYGSVRTKMLAHGWSPYTSPQADQCSPDDERCRGRPEMESCAGTGMAPCRFLWTKGQMIVAVLTVGEENPVIRNLESAGELRTTSRPSNGSSATEGAGSIGTSQAPLEGLIGYWSCQHHPSLNVSYGFFPDGTYVREVNNGGVVTQTAGRAVLKGARLVTLSLLVRGPEGLGSGGQPPWYTAQNNGNPKDSTSIIAVQELRRAGTGLALTTLEVANPDGTNSMPERDTPKSCEKVDGVELGLSNARRSAAGRL